FLFHLGPVAAVGLVLDWAVLHWLYLRETSADTLVDEAIPAPVERPQMRKTAFVMALVVGAFFAGVPPALSSAVGAAVLLIGRSEEHTSELQSRGHLVCRLLLEKKNRKCPHSVCGR